MKVNFFIAGAPKSGTTSLYQYLCQHKEIEMCSIKEPDFFSSTALKKEQTYYGNDPIKSIEKYNKLFSNKKDLLRGEASVSYLFYDDVAKKIKKYNEKAKIIIILRNPVDRAFSHYLMDYRLGLVSENFEDIVKKRIDHKNALLYYQQYVSVGEYYHQVERYIKVFGPEKLLIVNYDDFKNNLADAFEKICLFLNISHTFKVDFTKSYNIYKRPRNKIVRWVYSFTRLRKILSQIIPKIAVNYIIKMLFTESKKPKLSSGARKFLISHYKDDIINLSKLLNQDLSSWIK